MSVGNGIYYDLTTDSMIELFKKSAKTVKLFAKSNLNVEEISLFGKQTNSRWRWIWRLESETLENGRLICHSKVITKAEAAAFLSKPKGTRYEVCIHYRK